MTVMITQLICTFVLGNNALITRFYQDLRSEIWTVADNDDKGSYNDLDDK